MFHSCASAGGSDLQLLLASVGAHAFGDRRVGQQIQIRNNSVVGFSTVLMVGRRFALRGNGTTYPAEHASGKRYNDL